MVYKQVSLDITPAQMRKAAAGKQITLSASQLKGGSVKTYLHPANVEKILKSKRANRGARVFIAPGAINYDLETMKAGSIWSWIKEKAYPWLKNNWNVLKPVASALADTAIPAIATAFGQPTLAPVARGALKQLTGVGVGGKLTKGSAAAKQRMAALRAMKKGSGGSFKL